MKELTPFNQPDCAACRIRFYKQNLFPRVLSLLEYNFSQKPKFETGTDLLVTNVKKKNPNIHWFVNAESHVTENALDLIT